MDVIKRRQPLESQENLFPKKSKDKISKRLQSSKTCFFYANVKKAKQFVSVLLPVKDLDEHDSIWFFVPARSYKNGELNNEIPGQLLFHGKKFSDFLLLEGKIIISKDRKKIKELWKPVYKDWFKKGANKTGVTLIKLEPAEGYYWNAKQNMVTALPKISDAKTHKSPGGTVEKKIRNG